MMIIAVMDMGMLQCKAIKSAGEPSGGFGTAEVELLVSIASRLAPLAISNCCSVCSRIDRGCARLNQVGSADEPRGIHVSNALRKWTRRVRRVTS